MRFASYGKLDTPLFEDGDNQFVGLDMVRDRGVLTPGIVARSQNKRLSTKRALDRNGMMSPSDYNIAGGFNRQFVGCGVFSDPNSNVILLVAPKTAQYVLAFQFGRDPLVIPYSAAEIASGRTNGVGFVNFVQSFDSVLLLRYPFQTSQPNLVWDGDPTHTFTAVTLGPLGRNLIPVSASGEPFENRILFYNENLTTHPGGDDFIMSDANDYTSYDPVFQEFEINSGQSDFIVRVMSYFLRSALVLKSQSIHQISNFSTGDPTQTSVQEISGALGTVGSRFPLEVGNDVYIMSDPGGIYRLSEIIQIGTRALPQAVSEPIQPVIDQINWSVQGKFGCSAAIPPYAFFGLALGQNATRCNAIGVFNTQTNLWESVDEWDDPTFGFNALELIPYNNQQRLFAIDYVNSVIYLLYEGFQDITTTGIWSIRSVIETRGYGQNDSNGNKQFARFSRAKVAIGTSDAEVTLTAISDGYNEEKVLTPVPITKDRSKFYIHGHKDFDPATDDPNEPKREDYSLSGTPGNIANQDFESLPAGPITMIPGSPPDVIGPKQQSLERRRIGQTGRWVSLRIENDNGVCDLIAAGVDGRPAKETARVAA